MSPHCLRANQMALPYLQLCSLAGMLKTDWLACVSWQTSHLGCCLCYRKHGSKMASSNSWQRLLASRAFIVDMLFDEGCWPAAQNKEALQCLCTFVRDRHREARSSAVVDVS